MRKATYSQRLVPRPRNASFNVYAIRSGPVRIRHITLLPSYPPTDAPAPLRSGRTCHLQPMPKRLIVLMTRVLLQTRTQSLPVHRVIHTALWLLCVTRTRAWYIDPPMANELFAVSFDLSRSPFPICAREGIVNTPRHYRPLSQQHYNEYLEPIDAPYPAGKLFPRIAKYCSRDVDSSPMNNAAVPPGLP